MDVDIHIDHTKSPPGDHRGPLVTGRVVLGLIVLALGVLFLLDNFGILDASTYLHYWPGALILVGLVKLLNAHDGRERFGSLIWLAIGTWLLLDAMNLVNISFWDLWPVALIMLGIAMVGRGIGCGWRRAGMTENVSRVHAFALMSGIVRRVTSKDFRGGDATAVMGGVEIDLRNADITNGPAVFDAVAFWGGIDLIVPSGWTIQNDGIALLGAFEDNRKDTAGDSGKVLVIRGVCIMGGVEVKS
jgi:hypothetical protein